MRPDDSWRRQHPLALWHRFWLLSLVKDNDSGDVDAQYSLRLERLSKHPELPDY